MKSTTFHDFGANGQICVTVTYEYKFCIPAQPPLTMYIPGLKQVYIIFLQIGGQRVKYVAYSM